MADWPAVGDEVLVDTGCYGLQGYRWCKVTRLAPGSAAVYPVKVEIPERGEGQYATTEIADHRACQEGGGTPASLAARIIDAAAAAGNAYIAAAGPAVKAFSDSVAQLVPAFTTVGHGFSVGFMQPAVFRRHRRRCPRCNPWGNPPPMTGHYKPGPKASRTRGRQP